MYTYKETYVHRWREIYIPEKRSVYSSKETQCNTHCNTLQRTATHCNALQHKKDLYTCKKSPMCMFPYQRYDEVRTVQRVGRQKETYVHENRLVYVKRDLYTNEKRHIHTWKETYIHMKRALCVYFRTRGTTRSGRYSVLAGKQKFSRVSLLINMLD